MISCARAWAYVCQEEAGDSAPRGRVVCLGADFHIRHASLFGPFHGCYPATLFVCRSADFHIRHASLFGPFHGCYPATLFVCRITSQITKAEG